MLFEMNLRAQHLVELMKHGIVKFTYKKMSTGQTRTAYGTLDRDLIPPELRRRRGRPRRRPDYLVIYYDTKKHDIRSFKDELLKRIFPPKSSSKDRSSEESTDTTTNKGN